ncbi:MAG: hypothetical protein IPL53_02460 [Ignavibacteria bacterium]|nr:hypothetical protein [Ignavibacteria bacterium]
MLTKDFTKKIDNTTIVSAGDNADLLKNSERVKTAVYTNPSGPKIKYNGPDVKDISNESGENITPKQVSVTKSDGKQLVQVKSEVVSDTEIKNNTLTKKAPVTKTKDDNPNTKSQVTKSGDDNTKIKIPVTKTKDSNSKTKETKKNTRGSKPKAPAKKPNGSRLENDFNNGYPNTTVPSGENPVSTGSEKQNADQGKREIEQNNINETGNETEENYENSKNSAVDKGRYK